MLLLCKSGFTKFKKKSLIRKNKYRLYRSSTSVGRCEEDPECRRHTRPLMRQCVGGEIR